MTEPVMFSVNQLAEFPTSRAQGREGRARLEDLIADNRGLDLTIDFAGVLAMTISFADEFLGKFLATLDATSHDMTVCVSGLNPENAETIEVCLERREVPVVVAEDGGHLGLLGDELLQETYLAAAARGSVRATELAEDLSLSPQNVNNRLKRLVAVGALRKTRNAGAARGGKEFLYSTAAPDKSTASVA
ncbi:MAG: hypothetical protein JWN68_1208 [Nocardioides sp.]|jgi:hypothetical protein|nr:hypothetical protein [Nocardioides sp.]